MDPIVAAILGAIFGVLLGAAVMVTIVLRPVVETAPPAVLNDEVRAMIGILRSGVAIVGSQDEVVETNDAAERVGLVRGTRIGIPAILELVRTARAEGEQTSVNIDQSGRLGVPGVQLAVRFLPLDGGRVFVVADDRTPMLRAAESSRDVMTNSTHELKTPIGAILLLAEAVEGAAEDPDAVVHFARKIALEAVRLTELVQQIITLSKLQGRAPLAAAERLPVDSVVHEAVGRCRNLADSRQVSLTTSGQGGLRIFGDPDQLSTALSNLITNAISYSDPRARVVVTTRGVTEAEDDWVEIAVSDNGLGIAPEDQSRIFERFYRVDYARSRQTGGTGLGLSIVEEIASGHGGSVSVWSKPGSGSTFTLRVPAGQPSEEG